MLVPQGALSSKESSKVNISPCFAGPFKLPDDYEPASPAYLICHNNADFLKDIRIKIQLYITIESKDNCQDMAFFSASSIPEFKEDRPVYPFKIIPSAKTRFKPGYQFGEVSLRHFCLVRVGKRKKSNNSSQQDTYEGYLQ